MTPHEFYGAWRSLPEPSGFCCGFPSSVDIPCRKCYYKREHRRMDSNVHRAMADFEQDWSALWADVQRRDELIRQLHETTSWQD